MEFKEKPCIFFLNKKQKPEDRYVPVIDSYKLKLRFAWKTKAMTNTCTDI